MKRLLFLMIGVFLLYSCGEDGVIVTEEPDQEIPENPEAEAKTIDLTDIEKQIVNQTNVFAFNLFRTISANEDPDRNIFISPLSAGLALCMLNNGAGGITHAEIQEALGFGDFTREEMNDYFKKMMAALVELDPKVTFETANSIWINELFPVLTPFIDVNQEYYDAEVRNENFYNPVTLKIINDWCSEKTHGKIPQILDDIDEEAVIYLINALYFKGAWGIVFDKDKTQDDSFYNQDGTVNQVPMMNYKETFKYQYGDKFKLAEVPYGTGAFSMVFLLPQKDISLNEILAELDVTTWQKNTSELRGIGTRLTIPRFKVEYERKMNDDLKSLGMKTMFSQFEADFSFINEDIPVFVSLVKQNTYIEINEEGSEASAATVVGMETSNGLEPEDYGQFYLNRPFLYFIKEESTGTIIFMGQINNL